MYIQQRYVICVIGLYVYVNEHISEPPPPVSRSHVIFPGVADWTLMYLIYVREGGL